MKIEFQEDLVRYFWIDYILSCKNSIFKSFQELVLSGVYDMTQFEGMCIVSDMPTKIERDKNGRLHSVKGHAVEWKDGFGMHFIHGRFIQPDFFDKCATSKLKLEEYLTQENDEIRSAAYEIIGAQKMIDFLQAELVDECSIVHKNGEVEKIALFRTKEKLNRFKDQPYAWIKRICPSTAATYLTPTNPEFNKAIDAAKFHRPDFVPNNIDYSWYSRS
jgi:hypothetical protein